MAMKCPTCNGDLELKGATSTAMGVTPFFDNGGKYHSHDSNGVKALGVCWNNHEWSVSTFFSCPADKCDWNKKPSILKLIEKD